MAVELPRRLAVQMMFPDLEAELEYSMRQKAQWFGPASDRRSRWFSRNDSNGTVKSWQLLCISVNFFVATVWYFAAAEYDRIYISLIPLSFLSIRAMSRLWSISIDSCDPAFAIWMPRPVEGDTTWNNIEHHCCIWPSKRSNCVCNQLLDALMLSHRVHINTLDDLKMRGPMAIESCADVCGHRHGVHSLLQAFSAWMPFSTCQWLPSSLGTACQVMNLPESCWKLKLPWGVVEAIHSGRGDSVCFRARSIGLLAKTMKQEEIRSSLSTMILSEICVHANGFPRFCWTFSNCLLTCKKSAA